MVAERESSSGKLKVTLTLTERCFCTNYALFMYEVSSNIELSLSDVEWYEITRAVRNKLLKMIPRTISLKKSGADAWLALDEKNSEYAIYDNYRGLIMLRYNVVVAANDANAFNRLLHEYNAIQKKMRQEVSKRLGLSGDDRVEYVKEIGRHVVRRYVCDDELGFCEYVTVRKLTEDEEAVYKEVVRRAKEERKALLQRAVKLEKVILAAVAKAVAELEEVLSKKLEIEITLGSAEN